MPEAREPFGIYLHWPFCQSKCPYCDFNSHVAAGIDQSRWAEAFEHEAQRLAVETGPRVVETVFLGGGTPSLMHEDTVARILGSLRRNWSFGNDVEITLEANPTSVEAGRLAGFRDAGVNRISMGIQALNDTDLRALGRLHSASEALRALETARGLFDRVSFDLIYARQSQTASLWRDELRQALALGPDHLSLYQLTIEDGTAFGDRFRAGRLSGLPDDDLSRDLWDITQEETEAAGLPAYEVSNHAKPGQESRHNLIYWRSGDWLGIGPGAHGRLTMDGQRWSTTGIRAPGKWLDAVHRMGSGEEGRETLDPTETAEERLMMGLRLREGLPVERVSALADEGFQARLGWLCDDGLVETVQGNIRVTSTGRPVLNSVIRTLVGA